jgi:UDP-glucuronate 4-epimerase
MVTCADVTGLETDFGFKPATPVQQGIAKFVAWYRDYYKT